VSSTHAQLYQMLALYVIFGLKAWAALSISQHCPPAATVGCLERACGFYSKAWGCASRTLRLLWN
jgi:hypothetical protein